MARSLQKFQVGESGDGAHLIAKAAATGVADYERAVRLFVAEEVNHARMLAEILTAAGYPTVGHHWSDAVFVRLRRLLGLRTEIMVLCIAEVIALRYYRALADGNDALLAEVSELILDDERRHVRFQYHRIRAGFAHYPRVLRSVVEFVWCAMALVVAVVVSVDHGAALRDVGVSRIRFIVETRQLFSEAAWQIFGPAAALGCDGLPTSAVDSTGHN